jgi:hypothetical protein
MFLLALIAAVAQAAAPAANASEPVARTPLQNYVTPDDFPQGVERSAAKPVGFKLTVGSEGRVSECLVTSSSGNAAIDSTTCRLMRSRTRFAPARDARGGPRSGEVQATIDWKAMLDGASGAPPIRTAAVPAPTIPRGMWESISRLKVQRGQISSCQWQSTGPVPTHPSSNACQNSGIAGMALRLAAENKVDFTKSEVVVILRMPDSMMIQPLKPAPAALVDLAAELEINVDGQLTGCHFVRDIVRSATPQKPDCSVMFKGPYGRVTNRSGQPIATKQSAEFRVEAR